MTQQEFLKKWGATSNLNYFEMMFKAQRSDAKQMYLDLPPKVRNSFMYYLQEYAQTKQIMFFEQLESNITQN